MVLPSDPVPLLRSTFPPNANRLLPLSSVPASSEEEDPPDPAVVLEGAMSDVRKLVASEAPILDIPFNLLQEACGNVAAAVSETPKVSPTGAAPAGQADPDVSPPDSRSSTVPDAHGGEPGDGEDGHVDEDAQLVPPGGGAAGGSIEEGIRGNADDEFTEFDANGEAQQGGGCSSFPQQEEGSKGFVEVAGSGTTPSEEMDSSEGMVVGADGDSPVGDESADFRASAIVGAESGPSSPESANAVEPPPPRAGPGIVVGELAASVTDTEQAVRHEKKEGSEDAMGGSDAVLVTDDSLKHAGQGEGVDGRSFMSISTKSLEGPAPAVKSTDPDAAAVAGSPGDENPPQPTTASFETNGHEENPVKEDLRSDDSKSPVPAEGTGAAVDESEPANADREKSLPSPRAGKDEESARDHSEEAAPAPAVVSPEEDDDDVDYGLDSDFGDDSGDDHVPGASTAAADASSAVPAPSTTIDKGETKGAEAGDDNSSNHLDREAEDAVDSPGSSPPDKTSALEVEAVAPEVAHAIVDDDSEYPADIDHVDDVSHSSTGSDLGTTDGSSGGSSSEGEEGSNQSSAGGSKTSRRSSSGRSSGSLSISDSDDGDSAHDDSTASSPAREGDEVGTTPSETGTTADQDGDKDDDFDDDDDDSYSLDGSSKESLSGSSLGETQKAVESAQDDPQATHGDGGGDATVEPEPETAATAPPDSTGSRNLETQRVDIETPEKPDQHKAPRATTSMGHTKSDVLEVASSAGAADGTPDCAVDEGGDGDGEHSIGKSNGVEANQIAPTEPGTPETEVAKKEDVYKPNLDVIDTRVDVGDLHKRFSLMLTSSFSPPADGSAADEPLAAASEISSAHPNGSVSNLNTVNEEESNVLSHAPADELLSGTGGNILTEVRLFVLNSRRTTLTRSAAAIGVTLRKAYVRGV